MECGLATCGWHLLRFVFKPLRGVRGEALCVFQGHGRLTLARDKVELRAQWAHLHFERGVLDVAFGRGVPVFGLELHRVASILLDHTHADVKVQLPEIGQLF